MRAVLFAVIALGVATAAAAATYQYDALGRLTEVTHDDGAVISYSYDANGNRTQVVASPALAFFSISDATVAEGGNLVFTVTRSGLTAVSHDIDYATADGTAGPSDYTPLSGTLTFAANETSKTLTVVTAQDSVFELTETVLLNLSGAPSNAVVDDNQGVGSITNDDPPPSFAISDAGTVAEGDDLVFTVTKTGLTDMAHAVSYATANGTAWGAADYTPASGTLTFAPGETSKTITVITLDDPAYEVDETVLVNLSGATNSATISDPQGSGVITSSDPPPTYGFEPPDQNVIISEGGLLVFTITKAGAAYQDDTIAYSVTSGTASASDYTAIPDGTVTFGLADTTKTVAVQTTQDAFFEGDETIQIHLSAVTAGTIVAYPDAVGTIDEDDLAPTFTVNDVSVAEGGDLVFTITKSGVTVLTHNVSFATATDTASAGDFVPNSGVLIFAAGETTKTVSIATTHETVYETNETLRLNLSNATNGAIIADSQGVGTITNNDTAPSFTINDVSVAEGGNLVFTVTKSGSTALAHNVNYATANGTAASGSDYTAKSGALAFAAGQASLTVSVATTQETVYETNETLYLNLSGPTNGATIADSQGVGTITNNDAAPSFSVNDVSVSEGGNLVFTITKSGATAFSHNVNYATANNTAVAGSDYTAKSGTLTFSAGVTTSTVSVATIEDSAYEANETMRLNLSSATNSATISDSQGIGTIVNDDAGSPPTAVISNVTATTIPDANGMLVHYIVVISGSDPDGGTVTMYFQNQPGNVHTGSIQGYYGESYLYWTPWGYQPGYIQWFDGQYLIVNDTTGGSSTYVLNGATGAPTLTKVQ